MGSKAKDCNLKGRARGSGSSQKNPLWEDDVYFLGKDIKTPNEKFGDDPRLTSKGGVNHKKILASLSSRSVSFRGFIHIFQ